MAESTELKVVVSMVDKISANLKTIGKGFAVVGGAAAAGMGLAIKEAVEFESVMSDISTLISGDSTEAVDGLKNGILELAKTVPKDPDELGAAAYDVLSAGIQGTENQLNVLEQSSKLATAGLGDTKGAVDIMTSSINAFNLPAEDAGKISDILFKTVKNGKTTVDEMAQAFGATAPIAAAAGVSLEEFSAATAALTTTGLPAAQAQNALRQATLSLTAPTEDMKRLFEEVGIESGQAAVEQDGLVSVMKRVNEAADGNQEVLKKAFGSVEALGAATSLTGDQYEAFTSTMADMTGGANAVDEAFQKQTEKFGNQYKLLKNKLNVAMIQLGSKVLPLLTQKVIPAIQQFAKFITTNDKVIAVVTFLRDLFVNRVVPAIQNVIGRVQDSISKWTRYEGTIGLIRSTLEAFVGKIASLIIPRINELKKTISENREMFQQFWNFVKLVAKVVGGALIIAVMGAILIFGKMLEAGLRLTNWLLKLAAFVGNIPDYFSAAWNSAKATVLNAAAGIIQTIHDLKNMILNTNFFQVGADLMQGLADGIASKIPFIGQSARSAVEQAVREAKAAGQIKSPSRVFMEIGGFLGEGMAIGMEKSMPDINAAAGNMVSGAGSTAMSEPAGSVDNSKSVTFNITQRDGESAQDIAELIMLRMRAV